MDDPPLFDKPIDDLVPAAPAGGVRAWRPGTDTPAAAVPLDLPANEVQAIAARQRLLIAVFAARLLFALARVAAHLSAPGWDAELWVGLAVLVAELGLDLALLVAVFRLAARVFGMGWAVGVLAGMLVAPVLWTVAVFVGRDNPVLAVELFAAGFVLGVGVFLAVNARATAVLRLNGVRVGLFGARRADLERLGGGRMPKLGW